MASTPAQARCAPDVVEQRRCVRPIAAHRLHRDLVGGEWSYAADQLIIGPAGRSLANVARDIAKTETYVTSRRERTKIEMLFAHLKRLDRLKLRDPSGAQDEFLLAATVQNLRKLAKLILLPAPTPA